MVVLHLDTGHVLAAAVVEGATATPAALTGGSHLVVRVPLAKATTVPTELLTLLTTDVDRDVLVAPTRYRVVDAVPRVTYVGEPAAAPTTTVVGSPGQEFLAVWQVGSAHEVVRSQLTPDGKFALTAPPGGTHGLVALKGRALNYTP
jgi:hypothetical protein